MEGTGHSRWEREQCVYAVLEQYGGYVLAGVWLVGTILIYVRYRAYQVAYLKKFPPINGVPLYMVWGGNPGGPEAQAIYSAMGIDSPIPSLSICVGT
jgi:hypothetical protein